MKMKSFFSFLIFFSFSFSLFLRDGAGTEIPDLKANGVSVTGIKFSPLEDISICWGADGSLWKSLDQEHWIPATNFCIDDLKDVEVIDQQNFFAISSNHLQRTQNGGQGDWQDITYKVPEGNIFEKIKYVNEGLYILCQGGKVFRSIDRGENWADVSVPDSCGSNDIAFFRHVDTGYLLSDNQDRGLWKTTNAGITWWSEPLPQNTIGKFLSISGSLTLIAGLGDLGGWKLDPVVLRIYEGGWEAAPLPKSYIPYGVALKGDVGVVLCNKSSALIGRTYNSGLSWSYEYKDVPLYSMAIANNWLYTTGDSGAIYKEALNTTGGINYSSSTPQTFTLSQNYPNPFNPVTKIKFAIPQQGIVELKVFDILGKEVVTLINESNMTPGSYEIDFNGNNLSTGVYYYRLTSGEFVDTKKMILMK